MRKGFTLAELLLAVVIVGVVSMLVVPALVNNVHNKNLAAQLKNMVANIEQVAQDELITHKTKDLSETDFADPAKILSENHFHIVKSYSNQDDALNKGWKTTATGSNKITYKHLNKSTCNDEIGGGLGKGETVVLKNGAIMSFYPGNATEQAFRGGTIAGYIYIDVNGNDKPNIAGRDMFLLWITKTGNVVGFAYVKEESKTEAELKNECHSNIFYCYDALINSNWKMDY